MPKTEKPKAYDVKPTRKQTRAYEILTENLSPNQPIKSKKEILLAAGYSKHIAKRPSIVMESKGWQQLLDEHLSEKSLVSVHEDILKHSTKDEVRLRAAELGYRLRKKLDNTPTDPGGEYTELTAVVLRIRKLLPS